MNKTRVTLLVVAVVLFVSAIIFVGMYVDRTEIEFGFDQSLFILVCAGLTMALCVTLVWLAVVHSDRDEAGEEAKKYQEAYKYLADTFLDQTAADRALREAALNVQSRINLEDCWRETYSPEESEDARPEDVRNTFLTGATHRRADTETSIVAFKETLGAARHIRGSLHYRDHWTDYLPEESVGKTPEPIFQDVEISEKEVDEVTDIPDMQEPCDKSSPMPSPGSEV